MREMAVGTVDFLGGHRGGFVSSFHERRMRETPRRGPGNAPGEFGLFRDSESYFMQSFKKI